MRQVNYEASASLPFGALSPRGLFAIFFRMLKILPANGFGRLLSLVLRKICLRWSELPVDLQVNGICMRCNLIDNVSERKFIFTPWRFDPIERNFMRQFLPRDGVFVDVGANVGIYSLDAAVHLSKAGTILAFEPNPIVFDRLKFNIRATLASRADAPRCELLQFAVSDHEGEIDFFLHPHNLGASTILSPKIDPKIDRPNSIKVKTNSLLESISEKKLVRIDVMKLDIEGAEDIALIPFLKKAPITILPRLILIENSHDKWQADLISNLESRDYKLLYRSLRNSVFELDRRKD